MNGKDILLGMSYIGDDLIREAEFGSFSSTAVRRASRHKLKRPFLAAAIIALTLLLMGCTVAAIGYAQGWFPGFFSARSDAPLSDGQLSFIEAHEQALHVSRVQNDWTVELKSAMNDGNTAYIILSVKAPEGVAVGNEIVDGIVETWMMPGNGSMAGGGDLVTCSQGICSGQGNYWYQTSFSWAGDSDGLANTNNLVLQLTFNKFDASRETTITDPFGPDADFGIHIENIVLQYEDEAYRQELLNGKYAGRTDVIFTPEETENLIRTDILAEGTWDFTVNFAESEAGIELLSEPVNTSAYVIKNTGPGIEDYEHAVEDVTVTSFVLRSLSAVISYQYDGGVNFTQSEDRLVFAVMKDGSRIELRDLGAGGVGYSLLEAQSPIVPEDVDYILMADGTKLEMPQ